MGKTANSPCEAPKRGTNISALRGKVAAPQATQSEPEPTPEPEAETPTSPPKTDAEILKALDRDLLDKASAGRGVRGFNLDVGPTLIRPEERNREYRGLIRVVNGRNGKKFQGVTQWGKSGQVSSQSKVVYEGDEIDDAVAAVNRMIKKKLSGGYEMQNPSDDPLFRPGGARASARNLLS